MYRDLVYRSGEDSYDTRDLVFRPGVDTSAYQTVLREPAGRQVSFAEIAPHLPRAHTSFNPEHEKLREIYDRAPFRRGPGSGGGIVEDRPSYGGIDERPRVGYEPAFGQDFMNKIDQADRQAQAFLNMYLMSGGRLNPSVVAGLNLPMVDPADVDPGGPESPEAMARFAEYLRQRRERGDFDRARQRLIQRGYPLGGV